MISDDPDEDADDLDDKTLLDNFAADPATKRRDRAETCAALPDWPESPAREVGVKLDPATIAWFRSTYVDWQQQAALVLRAWVAVHDNLRQATSPTEQADSRVAPGEV